MGELTGPVIGITLVLIAVFLPAAFMPGITGQLFRQFALVIASTAIISALNALTLKPAQCALWLRPKTPKRSPTPSTAASTGATARWSTPTSSSSSWMVERTGLMVLVFIAHHRAGRLAVCPAAHRLSARRKTRAMPLSWACCPKAPPSPGSAEASDQVDAILKQTPGIAAWVTVGGFSILDTANVSNIFTHLCHLRGLGQAGAKP